MAGEAIKQPVPGPPPPAPQSCDVVMKGGITSGVVYPSVLWVLSGRYRFRNVGGASAGAIAAIIAAAAEYGGQRGGEGRLTFLKQIGDDLKEVRGYLRRLFPPGWGAGVVFFVFFGVGADHTKLPGPLGCSGGRAPRRLV